MIQELYDKLNFAQLIIYFRFGQRSPQHKKASKNPTEQNSTSLCLSGNNLVTPQARQTAFWFGSTVNVHIFRLGVVHICFVNTNVHSVSIYYIDDMILLMFM